MRNRYRRKLDSGSGRGKRFSPLMLAGLSVPVVLVLIATAVLVLPHLGTHAAAVSGDCTLIVPPNPLSAQGLAAPYQLVATNQANGQRNEANKMQGAFVRGEGIDPATGPICICDARVMT